MKTMKKHLALLLAVSMVFTLIVVSTAITVSADPTAILELDMSNFSAALSGPTGSEITSGIVKSGSLASSTTLSFSQRPNAADGNTLVKGSFQNNDNGGTTYYIDFSDQKTKPVSTGDDYPTHVTNMQFFNSALEASDNTISFWIKDLRPHPTYMKQILNYRVDYNSSNRKTFELIVNTDGTWNVISEAWSSSSTKSNVTNGAFSVPDGWKHVVITNPARSGGSKTMQLYVNGEFKKDITLAIPDDATINQTAVQFCSKADATGAYTNANYHILAAAKYGEIKVYDTALSASDIADLYTAQLPKFTAYVAPANPLTKVLDLDMSNFAAELHAADGTAVSSGIVASGSYAANTTLAFSQRPNANDDNNLTQGHFKNSTEGYTYYIDYSDPYVKPVSTTSNDYKQHMLNLQFYNNDLESEDNMISFWIKDIAAHPTELKEIVCYRVEYNSGTVRAFDLVVNPDGTWNLIGNEGWTVASNGTHNPATLPTGAFSVPDGWKHVVITNPALGSGTNTMSVYVNGEYKASTTVNLPDAVTSMDHIAVQFFSKANGGDSFWRANFFPLAGAKLGGVGVYTGELTAENVEEIYEAELPYFTELSDITGYTASDVSVQYDGQSHNIAINAAEDATPGVSIAYTVGGEPFNGTSEPGSYDVTATITKTGYNDVEVSANLLIVAPLGSKLVDLDISNFVPQQTTGTSGIVNVGTSNTAQLEIHGGTGTHGTRLVEDILYDKDDYTETKDVLRFRIVNEAAYTNEPIRNNVFTIKDPAFETQPITVSLWVNIDPSSGQQWDNAYASILQYNALRDDDEFRTQGIRNIDGVDKVVNIADSRASVWQYNLDTMTDYYWGQPWDYNMKIVNDQRWWHHLVLTIPQWEQDGTKTCTAYVDGGSRTMTFDLDLDGHALKDSWISIASNENNVYAPSDISISDVAVYSGVLSDLQVEYLYNTEKDFFINQAARNRVTVTYQGSEINHIGGVAEDGVITVNYDENMGDADGARIYVGAYTEDNELLTVNTALMNGAGSLTLTVPADTHKVMIFTWDGTDYKAVQKFTKLINTNRV